MRCLKNLLIALVILLFWNTAAHAIPFTSLDKNVGALTESAVMSTSKIVQVFGASVNTLSYSGTFNNSNWSLTISGSYSGASLNLSFNGYFDEILNKGSFISTGTLGTATWNGSGTWSFIGIDPKTIGMLWTSEAIIKPVAGEQKKPDKHFTDPKITFETSDDKYIYRTDYGKYFDTEDGKRIGEEKEQISDWVIPKDGPQIASLTVSLKEDNIFLIGSADFDNGTIGGSINVVPEPSTVLLLYTGLAGFAVLRRKLIRK